MNKYLVKIAGNRLIRHIAENRENFPLSRLLDMAERGVIKSPEQLLPGRNFGALAQTDRMIRKHGMEPIVGELDGDAALKRGKALVTRATLPNGEYSSLSVKSKGEPAQLLSLPRLHGPDPGNHVENIRRLQDTHVNNHELFEMDEAFRAMGRGRTKSLDDSTISSTSRYEVDGDHWNPAVLLRESRDMSSNPYAHISPPSDFRDRFSKLQQEARESGRPVSELVDTRRLPERDLSASLTSFRTASGEAGLVKALQRGKPYQSNPTSSDIRRSRNVTSTQSDYLLGDALQAQGGGYNASVQGSRELRLGNLAYRGLYAP